ncbi:LysR family transcriptional regulator [Colwellia sp. E2M01]|uniref:LysR family transcriptional regulator n=1 Tax=Colwellia sp. E2M01 TaxID=2841561 RepID=UPI001C08C966|nr:LysR family transcriptional regulator [Colwellia sp. E2M01]MBU2872077.1 LysR family transcriptional regulator [Colwellia sp. E2M01]
MRPQELNLLMIFDAIMTEGSITRAADHLALTQPAVSNALARMRVTWKDELFIKDGRNIQPTAFANNLWRQIQGPLGSLAHAINQSEFNPATAQRTFRISAADMFVEIIWGPLRKIIEQQAPGINIHAIPNRAVEAANVLKDAEAELAINRYTLSESVIRAEHLLKPQYVVLMRPGHPLVNKKLTVDSFANSDHLLVSITGDILGPSDQALRVLGLKRRVAMTVNNAANVPNILKNTDLICVIPSIALEHEIFTKQLAVLKSPIDTPPTPVSIIWHKRQDNDAGLQWIRRHIVNILRQRAEKHDKIIADVIQTNGKIN